MTVFTKMDADEWAQQLEFGSQSLVNLEGHVVDSSDPESSSPLPAIGLYSNTVALVVELENKR